MQLVQIRWKVFKIFLKNLKNLALHNSQLEIVQKMKKALHAIKELIKNFLTLQNLILRKWNYVIFKFDFYSTVFW